jgi:uncharacterized membrane protein
MPTYVHEVECNPDPLSLVDRDVPLEVGVVLVVLWKVRRREAAGVSSKQIGDGN